MDLNAVLSRFNGRNYILYGGDEDLVKEIGSKGNILVWYTTRYNETSSPPQQLYSRFVQNMDRALRERDGNDSIIIIVGNGYAGEMRAEILARRILYTKGYSSKVMIFHGYPGFITSTEDGTSIGGLVKQVYLNGSIVAPLDDRVAYLQEIASLMNPTISIPVPLSDQDLLPESAFVQQVKDILPYIHLVSRIRDIKEETGTMRVPISNNLPVDILNLRDQQKQREYNPNDMTSAIHWGQRKLLISEIELLVEVLRHDIQGGGDGRGFLIVYVGAAPGSHIPYLLSLFSSITDIRAHVWDRPSRFDIKEDTFIKIVPAELADPAMIGDNEGFFTDTVAQRYRDTYGVDNKIIFISDIRDRSSEEAVDIDMQRQRRWVDIMQPYASQLKFRLPFNGQNQYEYLAGDIYTQAWGRIKSTETRLLSFRPYASQTYNIREYDRYMSYFNTITRMSSYDIGRTIDTAAFAYKRTSQAISSGIGPSLLIPEQGFCTCHDCAREAQVIGKYMGYVGFPPNQGNVTAFIRGNTNASRPRNDPSNIRTLWNRVIPRAPPSDRSNIVIFRQLPMNYQDMERQINISWMDYITRMNLRESKSNTIIFSDAQVDHLSVTRMADILIYGDGMDMAEMIDAFARKDNRVLSLSQDSPLSLMRSIVSGERPRMVINFHTDFVKQYNPAIDIGTNGVSQYNIYRQGLLIRPNAKNTSKIDPYGQLLLYAIANGMR